MLHVVLKNYHNIISIFIRGFFLNGQRFRVYKVPLFLLKNNITFSMRNHGGGSIIRNLDIVITNEVFFAS